MSPRQFFAALPVLRVAAALLMLGLFALSTDAGRSADAPRKTSVTKSDQRCHDLQAQFDAAIVGREQASHAAAAETLRAEGVRLCGAGKPSQGARRLFLALKQIGVTPKL